MAKFPSAEVIQRAIDRVWFCHDLIQERAKVKLPRPAIEFDLYGSRAGEAHFRPGRQHLIRLNPILLAQNVEDFIDRTPGHEIAHIAAHIIYPHRIKPHGTEWARVMYMIGQDASPCHQFDTSESKKPVFKGAGMDFSFS